MNRVLIISSHHLTGACEDFWCQAAIRLARDGSEVRALANWSQQATDRVALLQEHGVDFEYSNPRFSDSASSHIAARLPYRFRSRIQHRKIESAIANPDISFVLFSQGNDHSAARYANLAADHGVPYGIVTHGVVPSDWPEDSMLDFLSSAYTRARKTYWVSERNQRDIEYQLGQEVSSGELVYNPVKVSREAPFQWPDTNEPLKLATVSRLQVGSKGQDLLLRALASPEWGDREYELTLFGDGENMNSLKRLASFLGLSRVRFAGYATNVETIWKDHHVLVQPSRHEGMPLSLVESMMLGRPALVTDVAGHSELIRHLQNGVVADSASVGAIRQAMNILWQNREGLREMGRDAYNSIRAYVPEDPIEDFVQRFLQTFGTLNEGSNAATETSKSP